MSYIKKFNPYELPDATLHAIATGRERVLEDILSTITRNAEGGAVQHLQVVAPRGYGKSFLMRLVQSAVRARVAEGLPVALALLPEEQHNVDAPHRLLNEIQRVLEGRPATSLLGGAFTDSEEAWEPAVAGLDAAISARLPEGRGVAVAIIENFDQLISEVFRKPRDQSRLRALLARPGGRLMLLATATRRADAAYEQRLFQATRLIELEPWKEESCLAFFERLRGQRQSGPMSPQTQGKARAIAQFIGGSPRMATVLAEVLDSNDSLQAAQMLDALVDELTPYYKHRIESLSRRARTLLDALLRMGEPRTQSEIAARLGTVQARIAEPFNELRAHGEVVGVKAQHSAEMLYRVSDRLMAHYYRKRHLNPGEATSLLEGIIELLAVYYTPEEKQAEAERLRALGHTEDAAVLDRLVAADLARLAGGRQGQEQGAGKQEEWAARIVALMHEGHAEEALAVGMSVVESAEASDNRYEQMAALVAVGWALGGLKRYSEAEDTLRRAIILAGQVGDLDGQIAASAVLGEVLIGRKQYEEAEKALRRTLALAEKAEFLDGQAWASLDLGALLSRRKRYAEAEGVLRRAVTLTAQAGNPRSQMRASRHLGWTLMQLGRHKEAEDILRRTRYLAEQAEDLREQAVVSRYLGLVLAEMKRHEEAVETLHSAMELAERASDREEVILSSRATMSVAHAAGDDASVMASWQRGLVAAVATSNKESLSMMAMFFDDAAVSAMRLGQLDAVWSSSAVLPIRKTELEFARQGLAAVITAGSRTRGRAAAYALAAHMIDVLMKSAVERAPREEPSGPDPIEFLRKVVVRLAEELKDPSLLRDLVALLEERLKAETMAERALLEAAARRMESVDDPGALERVDPDVVTALERMVGAGPQPKRKSTPRRGKRSSAPRRKR